MTDAFRLTFSSDFTEKQQDTIATTIEQAFVDGKAEAYSWVLRDREASPAVRMGTDKMLNTLEQSLEHERRLFWRYTAWCFAHNVAVACAIEAATTAQGERVLESKPVTPYLPPSKGEWACEFRNGGYFQTLEADNSGPYATAWKFPTKEAAERFMDQHVWIYLNGGMARKGP